MTLFKNESITVKNIPVTLTDGKYVNGTTVTRTIKANIQQLEPDDKKNETYGGRIKKIIQLVTNEQIYVDEFVTYNSEDYLIVSKRDYTKQNLVKLGNIQAIGVIYND
jgi:hypothetical protein